MKFRLRKYATKPGVNRKPGEMESLLNTTPMLVRGAEKTRTGYSVEGSPLNSLPATLDYFRFASTESPSEKEVAFFFGHSGATQKVYMSSWVNSQGSWVDGWVEPTQYVRYVGAWSFLLGSTRTIVIENAISRGFPSLADHYYDGWTIRNENRDNLPLKYAHIVESGSSGSSLLITLQEDISGEWVYTFGSEDVLRFVHWTEATAPTFSYPSVITHNGAFRIGFGRGSQTTNKPLWAGYMDRTYFPGVTVNTVAGVRIRGTYVNLRELINPGVTVTQPAAVSTLTNALAEGMTYRVAVSFVYDGYQISPLTEFTGIYLTSGYRIDTEISISLGQLNKRVTAIEIYASQDGGDTTSTGRVNPYYFIQSISLVDSESAWAWSAQDQTYEITHTLNLLNWTSRGNRWEINSGYEMNTDTMYSYDQEVNLLERQWITRVYNYTDGKNDLDRVYTNPRSGYGLVQPDVFSYEPDVFVGRILWGDSSYISGIVSNERGRLFVMKDRALVDMGISENPDGTINFSPVVISHQIGCACPNTGFTTTPFGIFFQGYDDIYKYDGKVTPLTLNDWQETYRNVNVVKNSGVLTWYKNDDMGVYFQFNAGGWVYFLATEDWRQFVYHDTPLQVSVKRDGTVVFSATGGVFKFDQSNLDNATPIKPYWKTGEMRLHESDEVFDFQEVYINKPTLSGQGTLKCKVSRRINGSIGTSSVTEWDSLDTSASRLWIPKRVEENSLTDYINIEYNTNASPEVGVIEFGDIEVVGIVKSKKRLA